MSALLKFSELYAPCPICNGECGRDLNETHDPQLSDWVYCSACDGEGEVAAADVEEITRRYERMAAYCRGEAPPREPQRQIVNDTCTGERS